MVAAETSLLGLLSLAGILLGRAAAGLGPLAASGAALAATGPLVEAAAPGRAHGSNSEVGLLLVVLGVNGGGGEHRQQLLVAVDGGSAPVGLVGQGADLLVVILGELQADCRWEAAQEQQMAKRRDRSSPGWTNSSISERSSEGRRLPRGSEEKGFSAFW